MKYLDTKTGKGKELATLLRWELKILDTAKWFEVRFGTDELVVVKCEYLVEEQEPR